MPDPENFDFALEDHISGEIGERVRSILSAAESAAEVIRHEAEQEIAGRKRIAESERTRYLETARQEADELLRRRIQRMTELSESLLEGAERLLGQIDGAQELRRALDRTVAELARAAERLSAEAGTGITPSEARPVTTPAQPVPEPEPEHVAEPAMADVEIADAEEAPAEPSLRAAPAPDEATENGARTGDDDAEADDVLAARLVALQMAVAGCPRGEVEEHLRSNFAVADTTSILNDVFGSDIPRLR